LIELAPLVGFQKLMGVVFYYFLVTNVPIHSTVQNISTLKEESIRSLINNAYMRAKSRFGKIAPDPWSQENFTILLRSLIVIRITMYELERLEKESTAYQDALKVQLSRLINLPRKV
jgi:hypothetical protein